MSKMKAYIVFLLSIILCSCHANFESARVDDYKPHDRLDDNLKGNVYKVESISYSNTSRRLFGDRITDSGKIIKQENYTGKTICTYSDNGIRLSVLRFINGKFQELREFDDLGRLIYYKYKDGSVESITHKMISDDIELVEISGVDVDSEGNEIESRDSYTIEYDKKKLPLITKDNNGKIIEEWVIGKESDNTEVCYYYDDYPQCRSYYIYDKGILIERHEIESNKVYTYATECVGEVKVITETLESNPKQIESIEEYKDGRLIKRVSGSYTTYYNENGDEIRSVWSGTDPYSLHFEYEYDSYGNWVVKRGFHSEGDCTSITLRSISYYDDSEASNFLNAVIDNYVLRSSKDTGFWGGSLEPVYNTPGPSSGVTFYSDPSSSSLFSSTPTKCSRCNETGNCKTCGGTGRKYDYGPLSVTTHEKYDQRCGVCNGSGKCGVCDGKGHI